MADCKISYINHTPFLTVGEEVLPACAYITYFEENNDYKAFADNGFRVYSVTVSLASQPINTTSGFTPFMGGVFDQKGIPDYSSVDASIAQILEKCPNAYIFPRVYVTMPEWWVEENPTETVPVPHDKRREALYSQKFKEDAAEMLRLLIDHFNHFFASGHIVGYQISGGNTQEWFHLDLRGSYCENALPYFNQYLIENEMEPITRLPDIDQIHRCAVIQDPVLSAYIRFVNDCVADTVEYFCKVTKEAVADNQMVGVFYGYTLEVSTSPLWGTLSLKKLLNSPYIDFFSSPNSYTGGRALGIDWPDMIPSASVQLHGKFCFMECDIRTFLTKLPNESRPGSDPYQIYTGDVFKGPPTEEESVWAVRKSLARQLIYHHGLWWFDMFGHWYATPSLMREMQRTNLLYNERLHHVPYEYPIEVAVFLDEEAYSKIGKQHPNFSSGHMMRHPLGTAGAPYSLYLASDFEQIDWENTSYKAVLFVIPGESDFIKAAKEKLSALGIGTRAVDAENPAFTTEQLVDFYKENGVFLYGEAGDVIYFGNGYASLHAATAGDKTLRFPRVLKCTDLITDEQWKTDSLTVSCKRFETRLFKVEAV